MNLKGALVAIILAYSSGGVESFLTSQHAKASTSKMYRNQQLYALFTGEYSPRKSSPFKKSKNKKWTKRVWRRVFSKSDDDPTRMQAALVVDQDGKRPSDVSKRIQNGSILRLWESISSQPPATTNPTLDVSERHLPTVAKSPDVVVRVGQAAAANDMPEKDPVARGSPLTKITRNTFEKVLTERMDRWSNSSHENMKVECNPTGKVHQIARGQFHCDATINLDRVVFGNIRLSGGQLEANDFCLNLLSFAGSKNAPRYPQQFELVAKDLTFSQDDLFESSCIRNGLQRLLIRILKRSAFSASDVSVNAIKILDSGKVCCLGQATTTFGSVVHFEVRSGIEFSRQGHLLTLPGLEVSINPSLGLFVPIIPDVTVDLGHHAQILGLTLDGRESLMRISAKVKITPDHNHPKISNYVHSNNGALCSVDVGRWLTRIGRFAH